jgi:hypothetical protein
LKGFKGDPGQSGYPGLKGEIGPEGVNGTLGKVGLPENQVFLETRAILDREDSWDFLEGKEMLVILVLKETLVHK